jgi:hypothetical protein
MAIIPSWIYRNTLFTIVAFFIVLGAVYVYATPFSKTITVANHSSISSRRHIIATISDEAGNVYMISNQILLLHFNAVQLALMLEKGSRFKVSGYGYNIPALGIYPNITSATKLSG